MTAASDSPLSGASLNAASMANIAYIGPDQRLFQAVKEGGNDWENIDLISAWQSIAGISIAFPRPGTGPRGDGALAVFAIEPPVTDELSVTGNVVYVCYLDVNNHVVALPYPLVVGTQNLPKGATIATAWNPDLTQRTGAPMARADSGVAGYGWTSESSYHVVYIGSDGNIWELYWVPRSNDYVNGGLLWQANNLSVRTGYSGVLAPRAGSPITATMFQREGSEHVFYIAGDNTIRELWFYDGHWGGNNLSQRAGALAPAANSPLTSFACDYEDTLHVCYLGSDGAVHELWWTQQGWQPDHTISNYGTTPAAGTDLAGYVCEYDQTHHVLYTDTNSNVIELYRSGNAWNYSLLVPGDGSSDPLPPLSTAGPLAGFSTENEKTEHVVYLDQRSRVVELYRANNRWNVGEIL